VFPILRLIRPHQWVKNAFVAAPLFFTPKAVSLDSVLLVAAGVACFCMLSSGVYILNDFLDREADRQHPVKRNRPLAANTVPVPAALAFMAALIVADTLPASTIVSSDGAGTLTEPLLAPAAMVIVAPLLSVTVTGVSAALVSDAV